MSVPDKAKQTPYDFYQNFEEAGDEGDTSDSLPDMEIEVGTLAPEQPAEPHAFQESHVRKGSQWDQ